MSEPISKTNTRFCANCKHLVGVSSKPETSFNWKCAAPANIAGKNLITGEVCYLLSIAELRSFDNNPCGFEGKLWEEYIPPVREYKPWPVSSSGSLLSEESFSAEALAIARDKAAKRMAEIRAKKAGRASLTTNDLENL